MQNFKTTKRRIKSVVLSALFICFLLESVFLLSGCIVIRRKFKYDSSIIDPESVTSISVYDFSNTEGTGGLTLPIEGAEAIYSLPQEDISSFLNELFDTKFEITYVFILAAYDPFYKYGDYYIRIDYSDGSYHYIADCFSDVYNEDGTIKKHFQHPYCKNGGEFDTLVAKYLPATMDPA